MTPTTPINIEDYTHYHRTCQNCGKNWWGLHCPHDGYQNPCPECESMPVVVNAHYCDCEFVVPVDEAQALIETATAEANAKVADKILTAYRTKLPSDLIEQLKALKETSKPIKEEV